MNNQQTNDPLHGVTLEQIVNSLVEHYGWEKLGTRIDINCFTTDPSVKSSLKRPLNLLIFFFRSFLPKDAIEVAVFSKRFLVFIVAPFILKSFILPVLLHFWISVLGLGYFCANFRVVV